MNIICIHQYYYIKTQSNVQVNEYIHRRLIIMMENSEPAESSPTDNDTEAAFIQSEEFIHELFEIVEKKKALTKKLFDESDITDETCDQIAKMAENHAKSNIFNTTSMLHFKQMEEEKIQPCPCGCKKSFGSELPLCMNEENLLFLGPGVLLFFFYLKYLRITIVIFALGYGSFALLSNIFSPNSIDYSACLQKINDIEKWFCQVNISSTYDRSSSTFLKVFQLVLGLIFGIIWLFSIKFTSFLGERKNNEIDDMLESSSDFTIRLENLPNGNYNEEDIIQFLNDAWENNSVQQSEQGVESEIFQKNLQLKSVQIIYNMSTCRELINKIQNASLRVHALIENKNQVSKQNFKQYKDQKQQYLKYYNELRQLESKFKEDENFRKTISTTCSLVQFKTQQQQKCFLKHFGTKKTKNLFDFCSQNDTLVFKKKQITISRAPEPSDINWANCQIEWSYFRYVLIWFITMIILYGCYALISYSNTLDFVKNTEGIVVSVVLQLFNRIIWFSLSYLVSFEYHNTKTQAMISLMKKSIFAQVMNVIVTPIFLKFFNNKPLYGDGSLASTMFTYQFIMFVMTSLFYVFNPTYYWKKLVIAITCLRNKVIRMKSQVIGEIDTFEEIKPVFTFYEGTQFPITGAYVYMITATFLTLFYCHLQPLILFILIFNITGFNFIMKYLLFRRSKIPELTNIQVFQFAIFIISFGSAFYGVGSLFFILIEKYQNNQLGSVQAIELIPSSLCIFLWLVLNANPCELNKKVCDYLFNEFHFKVRNFKRQMKSQKNLKVNNFVYDLIQKALQNAQSNFKRKQSYYAFSNTNKLLNFQYELKEIRNEKCINEHKQFCESFFNSLRPVTQGRSRKKSKEYDTILIPVELMKKSKVRKTSESKVNLINNLIVKNLREGESSELEVIKVQPKKDTVIEDGTLDNQ